MKRVMCINDSNKWWSHTFFKQSTGPAYGEICIVLDEVQEHGETGYVLEEYGDEPYSASLFIPLSEPKVAIEEEQEELEMV